MTWRAAIESVEHAVEAALVMLPQAMSTPRARVMLYAIGLQESELEHRRQKGNGPARGFWQFERGGVRGVLRHDASRFWAFEACSRAKVSADELSVHAALEFDDVLAATFARLLLFTDRRPLPTVEDSTGAWGYYLDNWRPGKPHPDRWAARHAAARAFVCGQ